MRKRVLDFREEAKEAAPRTVLDFACSLGLVENKKSLGLWRFALQMAIVFGSLL